MLERLGNSIIENNLNLYQAIRHCFHTEADNTYMYIPFMTDKYAEELSKFFNSIGLDTSVIDYKVKLYAVEININQFPNCSHNH